MMLTCILRKSFFPWRPSVIPNDFSREQGGKHGGGMSMNMRNALDGGDAEQMALVVTYFASAI